MSAIAFTIFGQLFSKANSRQLVTMPGKDGKPGRPSFIKSPEARAYEADAIRQVPPRLRQRMEGPVRLTVHAYYASEIPDLDISLLRDVLQDRWAPSPQAGKPRVLLQAGVYRNDRQVREEHNFHHIDRGNPRAEVLVEPLLPQQVGLLAEPEGALVKLARARRAKADPLQPDWLGRIMDAAGRDDAELLAQYLDHLRQQAQAAKKKAPRRVAAGAVVPPAGAPARALAAFEDPFS